MLLKIKQLINDKVRWTRNYRLTNWQAPMRAHLLPGNHVVSKSF